ncbi:MAG TPA: translesion DNA synthesis-associated protein ImuA [Burkholderiales bacterium]
MAALADLLRRYPGWRGAACFEQAPAVPSGFPALDRELPGGGWPSGGLTELLGEREGIGELQLVLPALAALTARGRRVAWLAPPHLPYAPALAAAGIDLVHLAVVRAPGRRDALWAAEQVLRAGSCHALLAWLPEARYPELRRLAVAAGAGGACALLFRPRAAAAEPTPAHLRLALEPGPDGQTLAVRILKRRGLPAPAPILLPVRNVFHALGRASFPPPAARDAGTGRRLGLPVHA